MLGKLIIMFLFSNIWLSAFSQSCIETDLECTIKGSEKEIAKEKVYRDCWQYRYRLDCGKKSKNNCDQIPPDDCLFLKQECKDKIRLGDEEFCANYTYYYSCASGDDDYESEESQEFVKQREPKDSKEFLCNMMCIDGNCSAVKKAEFEESRELKEAAAALNALGEIKKDLQGDELVNVFRGTPEKCSVTLGNSMLDCCRIRGLLEGIFDCGAEAVNLAKKRKSKKCVYVGKYCAEKIKPFGCIKRKKTFCCYDSILSRIINQEAKRQLGVGNGTAKDPNCGPIPLTEFEKVDLLKADFTDFYNDIVVPNIKIPDVKLDAKSNEKHAEDITSATNMPDTQKGFNPNIKKK